MKSKYDIVVIVGPTCSGKSDFAFYLANYLRTEIISADSRQLFIELNIGTAKPSEEYLKRIKHNLINHISITEEYTVADFVQDANFFIKKIKSKRRTPIIAGGTGLYVNSLLYGIFEGPGKDDTIRENLHNELNEKGLESLYEKLKAIDPEIADTIDKHNPRRVIRALEIYYITGKKFSEHIAEQNREKKFNHIMFGLRWDRQTLYERINRRVDLMIQDGFVDEVEQLYNLYDNENLQAFQTVGYKELIDYFNNKLTLEEAIELIKRNTRRYAKRQLTWFNALDDVIWIDVQKDVNFLKLAKETLVSYEL